MSHNALSVIEDYHNAALSAGLNQIKLGQNSLIHACVASGHSLLVSLFAEHFLQQAPVVVLVKNKDRIKIKKLKLKRYLLENTVLSLDSSLDVSKMNSSNLELNPLWIGDFTNNNHLELIKKINPSLIICEDVHCLGDITIKSNILPLNNICPFLGIITSVQRIEQEDISYLFKDIAYRIPFQTLIRDKILPDIVGTTVFTSSDLKAVDLRINSEGIYDFTEKSLLNQINQPARTALILESYRTLPTTSKTIIFCLNQPHVESVFSHFRKSDIHASALHSGLEMKTIRNIIKAFNEDRINTLICDDFLFERYENPKVDTLILASPTYSIFKFQNYLSQALRTDSQPCHKISTLIELRDKNSKAVGLSRIFSLPSRLTLSKTSALDLYNQLNCTLSHNPLLFNMPSRSFNIKTLLNILSERTLLASCKNTEIERSSNFSWVPFDTYTWGGLAYSNFLVTVKKTDLGTYAIYRGTSSTPLNCDTKILPGSLPLSEVLSIFGQELEKIAETQKEYLSMLYPKPASFSEKPTDSQIAFLRKKYLINNNHHLPETKGDAMLMLYKLQCFSSVCQQHGRMSSGKYFGFPIPYVYLSFPSYVAKFTSFKPFQQIKEHPEILLKWIKTYKPYLLENSTTSKENLNKLYQSDLKSFITNITTLLYNDIEFRALKQRR